MNIQMKFNNQEYNILIWSSSVGRLGKYVSIDTETDMQPFHRTANLVTFQAYSGGTNVYYVRPEEIPNFLAIHRDSYLLAHNFAFDADVISKQIKDSSVMYDLYDRNKCRDTSVLYRLVHLAQIGYVPFKYSLALLAEKFLGINLVKDETRENFGQFLGKSVEEIPEHFLTYGAIDVVATYQIYFKLMSHMRRHDKYETMLSHDIQVKGDLALNHIYKNGIGFDLARRDEWLAEVDKEMQVRANILATWGWVRGKKGIKGVYERIITMLKLDAVLPRTESGEISSKSEDLEPYKHHSFISALLRYRELEKASSFCRDITSNRVHPRYNLLVNTGRTSCSSPNFQQLPRMGGIREMFRASEGNTLLITDYSAIELSTLAQNTYKNFGYSVMRDRINDGEDLHKYYASIMYGCEIEDVTKDQRQEAKAANFGFPGGLGINTFIEFSRGYGLELTEDKAQEMKDVWFEAFPEMRQYMENEIGHVYTSTGRKRGNTSYCAEKNTPFQGLAADGAKLALYNLDKAGFKVVGFCHDEIVTEVSEEKADEYIKLQEKIMIDSMRTVVPDVRVAVESQISEVYTK
jgi:DNA polymerase I-like protein with 3'-5' exonuclease and polymerase domains